MQRMFIVDVGSTTTKALFFVYASKGWELAARGEASTTVEFPDEDIMIGLQRALQVAVERSGIVEWQQRSPNWTKDLDIFLVTSSAGGGLQMAVCGNVRNITAVSAERAALGSGAILLDVIAADDTRNRFQRMEHLRTMRPDMILMAGGVEGAQTIDFMVELCDFIRTAQPKAKYGYQYTPPIIYAGSSSAAPLVKDLLGERFTVRIVPNLRPSFDTENLEPTRRAIHELFIQHVMSHAPGYDQLRALVTEPVMPTPMAVGEILTRYAGQRSINILCCDIGGATTDIFSVVDGEYRRTVSANYGMSYSLGNVMTKVGPEKLLRWLQVEMSADELLRLLGNKLLYPTTIPATLPGLWAEQAAAREALNLAYQDHLISSREHSPLGMLGAGLPRATRELQISQFDLLIGSGGVISNAPHRGQAAAMLLDAFQPVGCTELMVDSIFMMPHLGAFAKIDAKSALEILEREGLIPLGTVLAPFGRVQSQHVGLVVQGRSSSGENIFAEARGGELLCLPLPSGETAELQISVHNGAQWEGGPHCVVRGGACGLILDLRGRPLDPAFGNGHYDPAWLRSLCSVEA